MSEAPATQTRAAVFAALGATLFAAVLAFVAFPPRSIWMDESWSASAAALSLFDAVVLTLRFDLHPPLYYVQLSLWGLAGRSDAWLFGNSVFWGLAAVFLLVSMAARAWGWRVGLAAGLIFSSLPMFGESVQSLRMYAFLMALTVAAWGAWRAAFGHGPYRRWASVGILLQWAIAYTQGAGTIMAGFIGLYALALSWEKDKSLSGLRPTFLAQIVFGLGCLPALANSAVRSLSGEGHTVAPDVATIVETLAALVSGMTQGPGLWLAAAAFLLLAAAGLIRRETRVITACFLVAPFILTAIVSHAFKPIWLTRLFVFVLPFIGLVAALLLDASMRRSRSAAAVLVAVIVLLGAVQTIGERQARVPRQDYRALAAAMQARVAPGDIVYAPRFWDYWATMRYAFGPQWGSPLAVQGKSTTDRWQAIYDRLGPVWLARLHLAPQTDRLEKGGVTYMIGPNVAASFAAAGRIWTIQPLRLDEPLPFSATHAPAETIAVPGLRLVAYERREAAAP
jgi:hypothetical protein